MKEFKVGQKVRIRTWEDMEKEFGLDYSGDIKCERCFIKSMKHLCGRVATITYVSGKDIKLNFKDESGRINWGYSIDMIEPVNETIVIYRSKENPKEVIALDKTTGKKAVAKCSPNDTFDFEAGAKLAFERLMTPEPKVDFRVLCVKHGGFRFKKGEVYTFINGKTTYENGSKTRFIYKSFNDFIERNPDFEKLLVELKDGDDPKEILKQYELKEIKIGDIVKVIDNCVTYNTYSHWTGLGAYKQNFVEFKAPENCKKYKVLNIAKHDSRRNETCVLIQNPDTTQVFIIEIEGIEKV